MLKAIWLTDIHLNFCDYVPEFLEQVKAEDPDAIFITGDIADGLSSLGFVADLAKIAHVYFVLGNHDYYHNSIKMVHELTAKVCDDEKICANWLRHKGLVYLTDKTALVGVDGWCDARYGNVQSTKVFLNDWITVDELRFPKNQSADTHLNIRIPKLRELAAEEARILSGSLEKALQERETVIVLTHLPPWDTAAWHEGKMSEPDWLPWFTCGAVGEAIETLADKYPEKKILVLCGHTHGSGSCVRGKNENVTCVTGMADYRFPEIQPPIFEIE